MLLRTSVPKVKFKPLISDWFAWYPVAVPEGFVWLEYVLRYEKRSIYDTWYYYERINGKINKNISL